MPTQRFAFKSAPGTRDIVVSGGRIATVSNIDVVLQNCDHAMRQQLRELRYNQTKGIEYFGNVFSGNPNYQRFKAQAITQLENVSGVIRVQSFDYTIESGELEYTAIIITEYGPGFVRSLQGIGIDTSPDIETPSVAPQPDVIIEGVLYAGTSPILAGDVYVEVL